MLQLTSLGAGGRGQAKRRVSKTAEDEADAAVDKAAKLAAVYAAKLAEFKALLASHRGHGSLEFMAPASIKHAEDEAEAAVGEAAKLAAVYAAKHAEFSAMRASCRGHTPKQKALLGLPDDDTFSRVYKAMQEAGWALGLPDNETVRRADQAM